MTLIPLQAIIPHLPIKSPQLGRLIYDMVLAHFLANDQQVRAPYGIIFVANVSTGSLTDDQAMAIRYL
jgi:hypothetical protein